MHHKVSGVTSDCIEPEMTLFLPRSLLLLA